jgi:hypothetical protein
VPAPNPPELAKDINGGGQSMASGRMEARNRERWPSNQLSRDGRAAVFRKEKEIWTLSFEARTVRVSHRVGLSYIAELLRNPGVPIEAAVLVGASVGSTKVALSSGIPQADEVTLKDVRRELSKKREPS